MKRDKDLFRNPQETADFFFNRYKQLSSVHIYIFVYNDNMQTFLPYSDFVETAKTLDRQRLGKQRVEAYQLLRSLTEPEYGWKNHPASKMWSGHELLLAEYGIDMCMEWRRRGYKDTLLEKFEHYVLLFSDQGFRKNNSPWWLGDNEFHSSHRSNLLRKKPEWYNQFHWTEPTTLPYVWPTHASKA